MGRALVAVIILWYVRKERRKRGGREGEKVRSKESEKKYTSISPSKPKLSTYSLWSRSTFELTASEYIWNSFGKMCTLYPMLSRNSISSVFSSSSGTPPTNNKKLIPIPELSIQCFPSVFAWLRSSVLSVALFPPRGVIPSLLPPPPLRCSPSYPKPYIPIANILLLNGQSDVTSSTNFAAVSALYLELERSMMIGVRVGYERARSVPRKEETMNIGGINHGPTTCDCTIQINKSCNKCIFLTWCVLEEPAQNLLLSSIPFIMVVLPLYFPTSLLLIVWFSTFASMHPKELQGSLQNCVLPEQI